DGEALLVALLGGGRREVHVLETLRLAESRDEVGGGARLPVEREAAGAQVETGQIRVARDQLGELLHQRRDLRLQSLAAGVDLLLQLVDFGLQLLDLADLRLDALQLRLQLTVQERILDQRTSSPDQHEERTQRDENDGRERDALVVPVAFFRGQEVDGDRSLAHRIERRTDRGQHRRRRGREELLGGRETPSREREEVAFPRQRDARAVPVRELPAVEWNVVRDERLLGQLPRD